jgi:VanZ family protein
VNRATQRSLRRSAAPLAWMVVIFLLSAQPDLSTHLGIWDLVGRKIAHMATYALLTWLWFWALRGTVAHPMVAAVAISLLYAVSDEYHQHFVHGRHGSPVDVLIDSVGIALIVWREERKGAKANRAL